MRKSMEFNTFVIFTMKSMESNLVPPTLCGVTLCGVTLCGGGRRNHPLAQGTGEWADRHIYIYMYIYIDFLLRRLIIKRVCYSPELVLFKTFRNLVRHDNSRKEQKNVQNKLEM
jgi:hypothetical protein